MLCGADRGLVQQRDGDVMKILTSSPIAKALMGKKVGDKVEVTIPRGVMKLEITKIVEHGA